MYGTPDLVSEKLDWHLLEFNLPVISTGVFLKNKIR